MRHETWILGTVLYQALISTWVSWSIHDLSEILRSTCLQFRQYATAFNSRVLRHDRYRQWAPPDSVVLHGEKNQESRKRRKYPSLELRVDTTSFLVLVRILNHFFRAKFVDSNKRIVRPISEFPYRTASQSPWSQFRSPSITHPRHNRAICAAFICSNVQRSPFALVRPLSPLSWLSLADGAIFLFLFGRCWRHLQHHRWSGRQGRWCDVGLIPWNKASSVSFTDAAKLFTVYCRALDLGRLLPMGLLRAVLQVRTVRTLEVDYNGREYCDIFSPRIIGSQESLTILGSQM